MFVSWRREESLKQSARIAAELKRDRTGVRECTCENNGDYCDACYVIIEAIETK